MRLLLTGATGFVGRILVPALLPTHEVALLLREEYGSGKPLPPPLAALRPHFETAYADLRNYQLTSRAVRATQPEIVVHLAAAGVTDPFLSINAALSHNITGTINLARACFERGAGPQQLVVARTPSEREAHNTYAASKAAAWMFCEMYARTAAWPIHGAMVFQAYGPHQAPELLVAAALRAALGGKQFPMTAGTQAKDWVHVDDVVTGLMAIVGKDLPPGTTVELGTGQLTSILHVVEMLYEQVGRGGGPMPGVLPSRSGEAAQQAADVAATGARINWQPRIDLAAGLQALVNEATDTDSKLL